MRPIKLTMSAFGSYAGVETIDFSLLDGQNIFVITGPTGAGKTTIFDGICYALFGAASGDGRDGESMRSHFAKEDVLTWVELEFELRGKKYYVKRIPKQQKKKERGEGFTEQKAEAEFKADEERIITGIREVNDKIGDILGINCDQFKQIVMIPQNEFRKLLLAESKDREVILRKIFGSRQFQMIQEKLEDRARELRKSIEALEQKNIAYISSIDWGIDEESEKPSALDEQNTSVVLEKLQAFIEKDEKEENILEMSAEYISVQLENLQKQLLEAIEVSQKFKELEVAEKYLESLKRSGEDFQEKEMKLQRGRRASSIKGQEEYLINRQVNYDKTVIEHDQALIKLKKALGDYENSQKALEVEQNKEDKKRILQENIIKLKKDKEKAKEFEKLQSELKAAEEYLASKQALEDKNKKYIEKLKASIKDVNDKINASKDAEIQFAEMERRKLQEDDKLKKLKKLYQEVESLEGLRREYVTQKKTYEENLKCFEESKKSFDALNELFYRGQAGFLAEKLTEGEPCSVCGSIHHPRPAQKLSGMPAEQEIDVAKKHFDKMDERFRKASDLFMDIKAKGEAQKALVEKLKAEVGEPLGDAAKLSENIALYENSLKELEVQASILLKKKEEKAQLAVRLKALEKELSDKEELHGLLEQEYRQAFAKASGLKALGQNIEKELSGSAKGEKELLMQLEKAEREYTNMEKSFKYAQELFRKAENSLTEAKTNNILRENAKNEGKYELIEAETKFGDEIKRVGFVDKEEYFASKISEDSIITFEKEIKVYNESLKSALDSYSKALKRIEGLKPVDIESLNEKIEKKKNGKAEVEKSIKDIFARLSRNSGLVSSIEETSKEIKKNEESYSVVGHLAGMAKGNNRERLSFERYVLASYFDDIIHAANLRLLKMTDGRFELARIREKQKGAAQQGLEIEVYDYYTGQPRHVKVISGGESFKASLSLALGLSDIVQSYAGGINLDTIFIDEGFGSLDQESLEKSIQCLLELQKTGKLVGVISHVEELKERVRARIEVTPSMTGSSTKVAVI